jgi:CRISPR-associated protein Cmr5
MQTRNQKLAAQVFRQIEELQRDYPEEKQRKRYGAMAHKLPVLIRTAGLAQALGFVEAKAQSQSGAMNGRLLDDLSRTIGVADRQTLLRQSREARISEYLHLTQKTLASLLWYKRFAQSVLGVEPGTETETQ